ncbi:24147_t:CDS:2 [Cetraspora pellucida]|uniref:24147_t:CDS:1 n=1 Tax=Cetraspora pellucida TaxID=1433469 RepID=A0A9N9FY51_9GLOM|nr:24147_t:CDS:2 [Cetraspora pellucida]
MKEHMLFHIDNPNLFTGDSGVLGRGFSESPTEIKRRFRIQNGFHFSMQQKYILIVDFFLCPLIAKSGYHYLVRCNCLL